MRHRNKKRRLSRNTAARKALLKSLATHVIAHERITTSLAKAKEARNVVERLITLGKVDTLHARRLAYRVLNDRTAVRKLFTEIAPLFKDKSGGYTRIIKGYPRKGDGAEMVLLELTEKPVREVKKPKEKKAKAEKKPKKPEAKEPKQAPEKEAPEKHAAPPPAHQKDIKREEQRSPKRGFFKDLRQYFKRKSMD